MTLYRFGNNLWRYRVAGLTVTLSLTFILILIFIHLLQQSGLPNVKMPVSSPTVTPLFDLLRTRTLSPPVVFLKIHRTGGSTVQNILFRMGERDSATFAFPKHSYHFNYPQRFRADFVDELPDDSSHFDILVSSLRFDLSQLQKLMAPSDPIFITILRDPIRTFESIFTYHSSSIPAFTLAKNTAGNNKTALSFFFDFAHVFWDPKIPQNGLAKNPLSFDLGLNNQIWNSSWPGDLALLEETFNLVMIAEHFDESLILLGALLNLELEELAYVRLNSRAIKDINPINDAMKAKIKAWNNLDVLVYDYFKQIFWEKAKQYGTARLTRKVKLLRESTEKIRQKCLARRGVPPEELDDLVRPWQTDSLTILGYEVNKNLTKQEQGFCLRMVLPEHQYHGHLYYQQYGKDMKVG